MLIYCYQQVYKSGYFKKKKKLKSLKENSLAVLVTKLISQKIRGKDFKLVACLPQQSFCFSGGSVGGKAAHVLHQLHSNRPKTAETCTFCYFDPFMLNSLGIRNSYFSSIYTQNNSQILSD